MPKPSEEFTWATNSSFSADGDAWDGAANKVDPGAARRAEGAEPDTFPAEWYNYHQNALGQHVGYINDVLEASDNIPSGIQRTVVISPSKMLFGQNGGSFFKVASERITTSGSSEPIEYNLTDLVPNGCIIEEVEVIINKQDTTSSSVSFSERVYNWTTGSFTSFTLENQNTTTSGDQVISLSAFSSFLLDRSEKVLTVRFVTGNALDVLEAVRVFYSDPINDKVSGTTFSTGGGGDIGLVRSIGQASNLFSARGTASACLNRIIPHGSVITDIKALVSPGNARVGSSLSFLSFVEITGQSYIPTISDGSLNVVDSETDNGFTGIQAIDLNPASYVVDSEVPLFVVYTSGLGDILCDKIYGIQVTFEDPGPRNF